MGQSRATNSDGCVAWRRQLRVIAPGFTALMLALLLSSAASAYTVVMRNGRRIEIPDKFTVTTSVVTYEAAPGIEVTVELSGVDIPATERVNREPPGSLLKRAQPASPQNGVAASSSSLLPAAKQKSRHALTDKDLERFHRARIASEEVLKSQRKEAGSPSSEDERRRATERDQSLLKLAAQIEANRAQSLALRAQLGAQNDRSIYPAQSFESAASYWSVPPFYNAPVALPIFGGSFGFRHHFWGMGSHRIWPPRPRFSAPPIFIWPRATPPRTVWHRR